MLPTFFIWSANIYMTMIATLFNGFGSVMPDQVNEAIEQILQAIYIFEFIFPVSTLFNILSFMIAFEILLRTKDAVISAINWIRGSGELRV
jgi:uncharacterized membrane protein YdcZ (DUF606 family)